jgi:hypothetical protein
LVHAHLSITVFVIYDLFVFTAILVRRALIRRICDTVSNDADKVKPNLLFG